jgi:hypothetical protein
MDAAPLAADCFGSDEFWRAALAFAGAEGEDVGGGGGGAFSLSPLSAAPAAHCSADGDSAEDGALAGGGSADAALRAAAASDDDDDDDDDGDAAANPHDSAAAACATTALQQQLPLPLHTIPHAAPHSAASLVGRRVLRAPDGGAADDDAREGVVTSFRPVKRSALWRVCYAADGRMEELEWPALRDALQRAEDARGGCTTAAHDAASDALFKQINASSQAGAAAPEAPQRRYKGVVRDTQCKHTMWKAQLHVPAHKRSTDDGSASGMLRLGRFRDPADAARAYDDAARALGMHKVNFPRLSGEVTAGLYTRRQPLATAAATGGVVAAVVARLPPQEGATMPGAVCMNAAAPAPAEAAAQQSPPNSSSSSDCCDGDDGSSCDMMEAPPPAEDGTALLQPLLLHECAFTSAAEAAAAAFPLLLPSPPPPSSSSPPRPRRYKGVSRARDVAETAAPRWRAYVRDAHTRTPRLVGTFDSALAAARAYDAAARARGATKLNFPRIGTRETLARASGRSGGSGGTQHRSSSGVRAPMAMKTTAHDSAPPAAQAVAERRWVPPWHRYNGVRALPGCALYQAALSSCELGEHGSAAAAARAVDACARAWGLLHVLNFPETEAERRAVANGTMPQLALEEASSSTADDMVFAHDTA